MAQFLLLIPTGPNVGLTTISIGLVRAFERQGVRVGFAKPIAQPRPGRVEPERSTEIYGRQFTSTRRRRFARNG